MKVSDYIVALLQRAGVRYVYGCVGGAVTHLVDSIFKEKNIRYIHSYHEQAAAFSASALAKYENTLGVAIATSGPGATNLITGIADAFFDSSPVLFITGQVNTYDFKYKRPIRQCGFQETDIVSIVKPITKYSVLLDRADKVEKELKKAIKTALSGRPGPVLVDIPLNIQRGEISPTSYEVDVVNEKKTREIAKEDLEALCDDIVSSKRPLMLVGGGCRVANVREKLVSLAEQLSIPVVVSLLGKDCFPNDHRLYAGFIGAYGNRYGNLALAKSDFLLVLGSRLDSRQVGNVVAPFVNKKIVQIDLEPDETDRRFKKRRCIVSNVSEFIDQFLDFAEVQTSSFKHGSEWLGKIDSLKRVFQPLSEPKRAKVESFHYSVMEEISRNLSLEDIVCVDIGQNQMLAAQVLEIRGKQRFITSGGMAPMGYSLPAGLSLAIASKRRVIVIAGDGGMQLNIHELNTVGKLRLPMVIFVLNNKSLGMIRQFQDLYFESRYCDTDECSGYYSADFIEIARAYGINGLRIDRKLADWRKRIRKAFGTDTKLPLLVQVDFDYPTYIYPKLEYDKPVDEPDPKLSKEEKAMLSDLSVS